MLSDIGGDVEIPGKGGVRHSDQLDVGPARSYDLFDPQANGGALRLTQSEDLTGSAGILEGEP
jgi:hypothetical protein